MTRTRGAGKAAAISALSPSVEAGASRDDNVVEDHLAEFDVDIFYRYFVLKLLVS
jgi:hypothetical protein